MSDSITKNCSICLLEVDDTEENSYQLKCKHLFHKDCLKEWLFTNKKDTCPLCRSYVIEKSMDMNVECIDGSIKCINTEYLKNSDTQEIIKFEKFKFNRNDFIGIKPFVLLKNHKMDICSGYYGLFPIYKINIIDLDDSIQDNNNIITDFNNSLAIHSLCIDECTRAYLLNTEPSHYRHVKFIKCQYQYVDNNDTIVDYIYYSINYNYNDYNFNNQHYIIRRMFIPTINCLYSNMKYLQFISNYQYLLINTAFTSIMNDLFIQRYYSSFMDSKKIGQSVCFLITLLFYDIDITVVYTEICKDIDSHILYKELNSYIKKLTRPIRNKKTVTMTSYDKNFNIYSTPQINISSYDYWIDKPLDFT
jgi:hypothetical protein